MMPIHDILYESNILSRVCSYSSDGKDSVVIPLMPSHKPIMIPEVIPLLLSWIQIDSQYNIVNLILLYEKIDR